MDPTSQQSPIDDMQFRQHCDFYPGAGGPAERLSSSAPSRSGESPYGYPQISRQNSTQFHGSPLGNLAQPTYTVNPHHDLYPAPPGAHYQHRQPAYHHGSPQSWPPYEQGLATNMASGLPASYDSFPAASPYPPPRLSPPPSAVRRYSHPGRHGPLAGSLDPTTGIFYRTPDHPRLRTAQACEKCRTRKAKCSGEHPSCKRCINRALACEYAKEGRVRGPNKPKPKPNVASSEGEEQTASSRNRSSSTNTSSSTGSSDYFDVPSILTSLRDPRVNFPHHGSLGPIHPSVSDRPRLSDLQLDSEGTINQYHLDLSRAVNAIQRSSPHARQSPRTETSYHPDMTRMADVSRAYAIPDPGFTVPQYQPLYMQADSASVMYPTYEGDNPSLTEATGVEHIQSRHHDSQTALVSAPESAPSYLPLGINPIYNTPDYLTQETPVGIDLHTRPDLANFSSQNYSPSSYEPPR